MMGSVFWSLSGCISGGTCTVSELNPEGVLLQTEKTPRKLGTKVQISAGDTWQTTFCALNQTVDLDQVLPQFV